MEPPPAQPQKPQTESERRAQEQRIRKKVACDKAVYEMQMQLVMDDVVPDDVLELAADMLQPDHYDDVVRERGISSTCGFPGCGKPIKKKNHSNATRKYHVSLSEHKVYDAETMRDFCSLSCAERSQAYMARLSTVSLFLRKGAAGASVAPAVTAVAATPICAPCTAAEPPPAGPTPAAHVPVRPGNILVHEIAERTGHAEPRPPQPPARPDLVEGHPVPYRPISSAPKTMAAAAAAKPRREPKVASFRYGS